MEAAADEAVVKNCRARRLPGAVPLVPAPRVVELRVVPQVVARPAVVRLVVGDEAAQVAAVIQRRPAAANRAQAVVLAAVAAPVSIDRTTAARAGGA